MVAAARSEASGAAGLPASAIARRPRADPMLTSRDVTAGLCGRPPARGPAGLGLLRCRPRRGRPPGRAGPQRRGAGGRGRGARLGTSPRLRSCVGRSATAAAPESPRADGRGSPAATRSPAPSAAHAFRFPRGPGLSAARPTARRSPIGPRPAAERRSSCGPPGSRPWRRTGSSERSRSAGQGCTWRCREATAKSGRGQNLAVSAPPCSRAWTAAHRAEAFKSGQKSFRNAKLRSPPLTELRSRGLLPFLRAAGLSHAEKWPT